MTLSRGPSTPAKDQDEIARIDEVQDLTRALVEHVGVDRLGPQERHPPRHLGLFLAQGRQLAVEFDDLFEKLLLGVDAVLAVSALTALLSWTILQKAVPALTRVATRRLDDSAGKTTDLKP